MVCSPDPPCPRPPRCGPCAVAPRRRGLRGDRARCWATALAPGTSIAYLVVAVRVSSRRSGDRPTRLSPTRRCPGCPVRSRDSHRPSASTSAACGASLGVALAVSSRISGNRVPPPADFAAHHPCSGYAGFGVASSPCSASHHRCRARLSRTGSRSCSMPRGRPAGPRASSHRPGLDTGVTALARFARLRVPSCKIGLVCCAPKGRSPCDDYCEQAQPAAAAWQERHTGSARRPSATARNRRQPPAPHRRLHGGAGPTSLAGTAARPAPARRLAIEPRFHGRRPGGLLFRAISNDETAEVWTAWYRPCSARVTSAADSSCSTPPPRT